DRLTAGEVSLEVLHPPAQGPEGNENSRSLVLLVRHGRHSLLLTGDLEGPGLERVLKMAPVQVGGMTFTFSGGKATLRIGRKAVQENTFTIDPGQKPRHIDLMALGEKVLGIYAFEGSKLKLCIGPGKRPTRFESPKGTKNRDFVLKRLKKEPLGSA